MINLADVQGGTKPARLLLLSDRLTGGQRGGQSITGTAERDTDRLIRDPQLVSAVPSEERTQELDQVS